jgi:hypothetical protein
MMSRPTILLAGMLVLVAVSAGAADKPPQHPVPGGPVGATAPDLVIDSIALTLNQKQGPCFGYHVARLDVILTIRNIGLGTAVMKGGKSNPWVTVSPLDASGKANYASNVPGPASEIAPNGTHKLFVGVAAPVTVPLNKASSTVTITATVNPLKLTTTESNYGNNTKQVSQTFKGELCKVVAPLRAPPPKK